MSRVGGYIVSPNSNQGLTTAWASMLMTVVSNSFTNPSAPGGTTVLGDVELDLNSVAGGATALMAMLTYDSGGLYTIAGPTAATAFATLSGALGSLSLSINQPKTWPTRTGITVGQCYMWLKTNAGTANLTASGGRLYWRDPE